MLQFKVIKWFKGKTMKSKSGFTLIEIVVTLLVIFLVVSYMIPYLGLSIFRYDRAIVDLQEMINMKMVVENITHDYVNRCFEEPEEPEEPDFDLLQLSKRIGQTNTYVNRVGSPPSYYPYGYDGQKYVQYFVKCNEFVKEQEISKKIHMVKDYSSNGNMLLVTIQPQRYSNISLTVLFTEK